MKSKELIPFTIMAEKPENVSIYLKKHNYSVQEDNYRIYLAIRWGFCPSRMTSNN